MGSETGGVCSSRINASITPLDRHVDFVHIASTSKRSFYRSNDNSKIRAVPGVRSRVPGCQFLIYLSLGVVAQHPAPPGFFLERGTIRTSPPLVNE